jgi:hypothetical protein
MESLVEDIYVGLQETIRQNQFTFHGSHRLGKKFIRTTQLNTSLLPNRELVQLLTKKVT